MRNIIYFNVFTSSRPSRFILLYRDNVFQGKSYEIKQDALRDECGSVPRLLFLRRESFKFFLEDIKKIFISKVLNLLPTIKGVLWLDLPARRFSPRVEPRKLPYSVSSALQQGKFLVTLVQQTKWSVIPLPDKRIQPEQPEQT